MKIKIKIRNAKEEDIANIANLYVYSWKKAFSKFLFQATINKLNVFEKENFFRQMIENNEGNILIAENLKNQEICGYIIYKNISKMSIEIISFYISPLYIQNNIGSELLNHLILYCNENYINNIVLWTFLNNKDSIKFYKGLGFYETGLQRQSSIELGQIEVQYILKKYNIYP